MYSWWWVRLSPETCRVKPLRRIKTQLLHLVELISLPRHLSQNKMPDKSEKKYIIMILAAKISKFLETLAMRATGRHRHLADPRHVQNLADSSSQRNKWPQRSTELQCDIEQATFKLYIPGTDRQTRGHTPRCSYWLDTPASFHSTAGSIHLGARSPSKNGEGGKI